MRNIAQWWGGSKVCLWEAVCGAISGLWMVCVGCPLCAGEFVVSGYFGMRLCVCVCVCVCECTSIGWVRVPGFQWVKYEYLWVITLLSVVNGYSDCGDIL